MAKKRRITKSEEGYSYYTNKFGEEIRRRKWGPDGGRINKDPSFAHIKSNQSDFTAIAEVCRLFRSGVIPFVGEVMDGRVTSRITKMLYQVKELDESAPGTKTVAKGIKHEQVKEILTGFNFNVKTKLRSVIMSQMKIDSKAGVVQIPNLLVHRDIQFPKGATSVEISVGTVAYDFKKKKCEFAEGATERIDRDMPEGTLTLQSGRAPANMPVRVLILKVGFLQIMNGQEYVLSNSKYNAAEIVGVERQFL